ncbi:PilZ domain-containing protein [Desulfoluna spongiiphila]|uniref:PilZ domain-containing protein n=1 Tax=Desulfoluna spongiiphila TaxID=419481 RepID=A0A1G5FP39_9BACT|nr:PilZ domain-containing protein [Desulfoluna spongiiphila]SCY41009.1 PilZ domain-containing protein [Desulfoluna spongiiphila]VVS95488.1 prokaryotic membrane lipoprotein lipid attachment site profile [Desulfoluna spongiiphila]
MEKRKHARFNSTNLLSYACVNAENTVVQQGMGKTLDVSEGGILLETHVPIDPSHRVQLDIGFRDDVVEMTGDVAYTRTGETGRSESGIRFGEHSEKDHEVLLKFIEGFQKV